MTLAVSDAAARDAQSAALRAPPACYLDNLQALYRCNYDLAVRIERVPFAEVPALERTRDGRWTARVATDDGPPAYLHSRYRPADEARAFVQAHTTAGDRAFLLAGCGLGYHLAELESRFDRPLMIVAEPDLALVKAALCVHDLSAALGEGRLVLLPAAEKSLVHERLAGHATELLLGLRILAPPASRQRAADFHRSVQSLVTDYVTYCRLQVMTMLKVNRTTFRNVTFNLAEYLESGDIDALAGRAAGYPAIVLAAGPSLARQLEQVLALRDRAVLIAVQTVFKMLRSLGTLPHFVTSLDFHEVSAEFFSGLDDAGGCALVAEPKVTWHVLDTFPGCKHVLAHSLYARLLGGAAPARGGLKAGSTVAHLAFYLARHLGCDPIILVGQDLCYSEGLFYPPGTPVERIWQPELGRFQTLEMKHWERIVRNRPILKTVRDVNGREAYSDELLLNYAEQFQADFAQTRARVVHAGEAGMPLAGAEVMRLEDAARQFCTTPLPPDLLRPGVTSRFEAAAVLAALRERLAETRQVRSIGEQLQELLGRLAGLLDKPREFNRCVARVDELRVRIQQYEAVFRTIIDVSPAADLRRHSADRQLGRVEVETVDVARRRLERDRDFVRAFLDGCAFVEGVLPEAIARAEERLK